MIAVPERRAGASTQVRSRSSVVPSTSRNSLAGSAPNYLKSDFLECEVSLYLNDNQTSIFLESASTHGIAKRRKTAISRYYEDVSESFHFSYSNGAVSSTAPVDGGDTEIDIWLSKIYAMERAGRCRAASKLIFTFVERKFSEEDIASVNLFLAHVDLNKLSVWSVSGLLRVSAGVRNLLPLWTPCLNEAKRVMFMKGEDIVSLFKGLQGGNCK